VTWDAPGSNGSPILAYEILFAPTSGVEPSAGTTTSQITVDMIEVAALSTAAGASTVSSNNLEWNQGSGTQFYEVVG
jgi:hypothetical protein